MLDERVQEEVQHQLEGTTQLTQNQLSHANDVIQLCHNLKNMTPKKRSQSGRAKGKAVITYDNNFYDNDNNIVNPGQAFDFMKLKYLLFLREQHAV